jgi:hypothetical protein
VPIFREGILAWHAVKGEFAGINDFEWRYGAGNVDFKAQSATMSSRKA